VELNFGGSSTLAAQITQGAPADVFASADQPNMQKVVDAGLAGAPATFATNRLQLVVGPGNPKGIRSLADLARPGLVVVLCAPAVPCGTYAAQALGKAGVTVHPASQEQDVKAVVTKVQLGEADAGIVYRTDVRAAGAAVAGVDIPADQNVTAEYPIAELKGASPAAAGFVDFVRSPEGQLILGGFGFGPA
jgi:molybdate transport system substrate-binding protein